MREKVETRETLMSYRAYEINDTMADILLGNMNNKDVWVCDFRYNSYSDKPIRHVRPQKVLVSDNSKTKERVYYSPSHFKTYNKKGEILKKIIKPFDTTGNKYYKGTAIKAFKTEKECRDFYKSQQTEIIKGLKKYKLSISSDISKIIKDIESNI